MSAAINSDYTKIRAEVLAKLVKYDQMYETLFPLEQFDTLVVLATKLGDSTARLQGFKSQVAADNQKFHDTLFRIKQNLEELETVFKEHGKSFTMPPCHKVCSVITSWIHKVRDETPGPASAVAAAITAATTANSSGKAGLRRGKRRVVKSVELISDDESDTEVVITGDITMADATTMSPAAKPDAEMAPADTIVTAATVTATAGNSQAVKPLKGTKIKEPPTASAETSALKALHFTKRGHEEAAKKKPKLNHPKDDYTTLGKGSTLAFSNSADRLAASASSVVGPAAASTISVAHNMVGKPTLVATEASLIQKEAHFRGEIDVTVSKIQLLLNYLEVVTQGHVKALNDLHIAGPSA
ncbi:hypothetical protein BDP27DRAFT_1449664 [Rhodocollybia butyracea]|uniref:Uncharacterized protein n=1 Tax=Rhodocollybia butyracea TaxID=206335 RepID=A0A9P5PMD6_9AGAR|nr:hypothetical protein BDP27DRAFT_1449664 [Rhodocollybia butyracea]